MISGSAPKRVTTTQARGSNAQRAARRATPRILPKKKKRFRLNRELKLDSYDQKLLDVAVLKQAIADIRLRIDRVPRKERNACTRLILKSARWLFTNPSPEYVFSPMCIAERLGVDYRRLALCVFESLPSARQDKILKALRRDGRCTLTAA
jgi:hypothetical protein